MKSARRRSREFALQGLYAWQISHSPLEQIIAQRGESKDFEKADRNYFQSLIGGAINDAEQLRDLIAPLLDRSVEELSPVERGILMLAAHELKNCPEVPYKVVIDEAVELAKSFGGTDGYKYVNGVLDKLARALRPRPT